LAGTRFAHDGCKNNFFPLYRKQPLVMDVHLGIDFPLYAKNECHFFLIGKLFIALRTEFGPVLKPECENK
jgi:hypothetical protein